MSTSTTRAGRGRVDREAHNDQKAQRLLELLRANPKLMATAEKHRQSEELHSLCRRFATSEKTPAKAFKKMLTHLEYRDRHGIIAVSSLPAKLVFGNHEAQVAYNRMLPHGLLGRDRMGQPVLYKHLGRLNLSALTKKGADLTTTLRYNEWITERLCHAMGHVGQWTVIVDVQGITSSQVLSPKWMLYIQSIASHDALHYPDRLDKLFMINVPSFMCNSCAPAHLPASGYAILTFVRRPNPALITHLRTHGAAGTSFLDGSMTRPSRASSYSRAKRSGDHALRPRWTPRSSRGT